MATKHSTKTPAKTKTVRGAAQPARPHKANLTAPRQRRLKPGEYKTLRLSKRLKHQIRLPNVWRLTRAASTLIWEHKRLLIGITLVYGTLNLLLVQGLTGNTDVSSLKSQLNQLFTGHLGSWASGLAVFVVLVGTSGNNSSNTAGAYQLFLVLLVSLALIWALRQLKAGVHIRVRDAYYRGMYPLVPLVLVLLVIAVQLLPLLIGSALYSLVISNGIAVLGVEKFAWGLLYGLLALLSFYMLSSSLFAIYIVTLPDMTPLKALRTARQLVRYRRWTVLRKVLFLPLLLLVAAAVIMLPIITLATPLAQWSFFALTMFAVVAIHAYLYTLYRELLNE